MLCSLPLVSVISHLFVSYYLSFPITAAIEQKAEREKWPRLWVRSKRGTSQGHRHPLMVSWPLVHEDTQQLKTKRHNYPQCMNMAILFGRQFFVCDMSVFAVNVWLSDLKNRHFSEGYNFFVNKVGVCVCVIMGCINKTDLNSTGVKEI